MSDARLSALERLHAATVTTAQLRDMPQPDKLVDSLLWQSSIAMIYGPSGGGKTFVALDFALHVGVGAWWHGRETFGGHVVYIAAEAPALLWPRVEAWCKHHSIPDIDEHHGVSWLPIPVNLYDAVDAAAIERYCAEKQPKLVVWDTLARSVLGADENSAKDMGIVVEYLDRIRSATRACVAIVHHSGKNLESGARGSSAVYAAADTVLEVTATDDTHRIRTVKQRSAAEALPITLRRVDVAESCVLTVTRGSQSNEVSERAHATLAALRAIEVPGGVSSTAWRLSAEVPERTFYEHRKRLLDSGLARNIGTDKQPRYIANGAAS